MLNKNRDKAEQLKKLPPPIGSSSYIEAATKCYYVDKTLLVRDIIDNEHLVTLFARPRRFGKTLNMDMLRVFFEKNIEDTSVYFKDKLIWQCGNKYTKHQGKYPVIYLTLKDTKFSSWDSIYKNILNLMQKEFKRHYELATSQKLNNDDLENYIKYKSEKLPPDESFDALAILSELLFKHYNEKPIIIIDEYDIPIQQGYIHGFYNQIVEFTRNMYSATFKDNNNLFKGFLTGILRVSKESIFSGFNNPKTNTVLDDQYSQYFGFTPNEVKAMARYYNAEDKYLEICEWYDGYQFGNTEIFNPWSVVNYFDSGCQVAPYWTNTSNNDIIRELLSYSNNSVNEKLQKLVLGNSITTTIDTNIVYPNLKTSQDALFSFLLLTGYLKIKNRKLLFDEYEYELTIPNKEVLKAYRKEILSMLESNIDKNIIQSIAAMLLSGNIDNLQSSLETILLQSVSFHDATEGFYHGLMFALCLIATGSYEVTSNRESGLGRYDILMMPKKKNLPGIIIEIKTAKKATLTNLKTVAKKAIKQIKDKQYDTVMINNNIKTVYEYGVAFAGKNVAIEKDIVNY